MDFNVELCDDDILLRIMKNSDFDALFNITKDPNIWDQHNDKQRCKQEGFKKFFEQGINNPEHCYAICYKGKLVGSTRYYEYDKCKSSVKVGYTFYAKRYWGTALNNRVKKLMLDYAFLHVDIVLFDIWYKNFRSQKAVAKLSAKLFKKDSQEKLVFKLEKKDWERIV